MLIKLASAAFQKASWPTSIQTGRFMYPPANNSRNVDGAASKDSITYEMRRKALQEVQEDINSVTVAGSLKMDLFLVE